MSTVAERRIACAKPCGSCPFRLEAGDTYFDPRTLDATVGVNLRSKVNLHNCHSVHLVCAGLLAFLKNRGELDQYNNWRIAERLDLMHPEDIDTSVPVFSSWKEALAEHRRRMKEAKKKLTRLGLL